MSRSTASPVQMVGSSPAGRGYPLMTVPGDPRRNSRQMTIREDELIERIRRRVPSAPGGVLRLGIGHDAAVLRRVAGKDWVVSCDSFIEGVHFLADGHPAEAVGYKSLARAASDLAAMGARPSVFLLGMVLPATRTGAWLDAMIAGMSHAARHLGFRLAG